MKTGLSETSPNFYHPAGWHSHHTHTPETIWTLGHQITEALLFQTWRLTQAIKHQQWEDSHQLIYSAVGHEPSQVLIPISTLYISTLFSVLSHIGYAILDGLLHARWTTAASGPTLWLLKGNDLSAAWTFPDDADIRTSQPLCGWHGCVGEVSLWQEMCWQERPVVVRAVVSG